MTQKIMDALKSLGSPDPSRNWVEQKNDYVSTLGLTHEDIPDLIAILELWGDASFFEKTVNDVKDGKDEIENEKNRQVLIMTPVHAWRALAHLGAIDAVEPMLDMLDTLYEMGDDWYLDEFPRVFQLIGPAALPFLKRFLDDSSHQTVARVCVVDGIFEIARHHDSARNDAIQMLRAALERYKDNPIELNAFLCDHLIDLHSVEDAELIERTFADECVDEGVFGTWRDARERLGVPGLGLAPDKPHPTIGLLPQMQQEYREKLGEAARKTKAAKKRQAKARKRNRRR